MQSFCKNDKMGYAESVLEEMIPIGLPINQGLFALIINWLCEAGQKETWEEEDKGKRKGEEIRKRS